MSITASFVIVFVLLARLVLKKAPKIFSYCLWAVVLFRLICPFSFESVLSILPAAAEQPIVQNVVHTPAPEIDTAIPQLDSAYLTEIDTALPDVDGTSGLTPAGDEAQIAAEKTAEPFELAMMIGQIVWAVGIIALLCYSLVSYLHIKRRVRFAIRLEKNIYECDQIASPFVLGLFMPKIYIPMGLNNMAFDYTVRHEQVHIKRLDYIVKPIAFFALCIHWFNPLVWLAFALMTKDMELSCDEAVLRELGGNIKKDYSSLLLSLASPGNMFHASPLAFGESNVQSRIKNVLSYKRPAFWVIVTAVVLVLALIICLAANPVSDEALPEGDDSSNITNSHSFGIMTAGNMPVSCEYGTAPKGELKATDMIEKLKYINGFTMTQTEAENRYIGFNFFSEEPAEFRLRYCSEVDGAYLSDYPISNDGRYQIKMPAKVGVYNFFADITWQDGTAETVYFDIEITSVKPDYDENDAYSRANELATTYSAELIKLVQDRINSYKDGTFEETANHHPPYPADFPPARNLPVIKALSDFKLCWKDGEQVGENSFIEPEVFIVVEADPTHLIVLSNLWLMKPDLNSDVSYAVECGDSSYIDLEKAGIASADEFIRGRADGVISFSNGAEGTAFKSIGGASVEEQRKLAGIAMLAISEYFESRMGNSVPKDERILVYQIATIEPFAVGANEFCVRVQQNYTCLSKALFTPNGTFIQNGAGYSALGDTKQYTVKYNLATRKYEVVEVGTGGMDPERFKPIQNPIQFQNDNLPVIMLTKDGMRAVADYYKQFDGDNVHIDKRVSNYELTGGCVTAGDEKEFIIRVSSNFDCYNKELSKNAQEVKISDRYSGPTYFIRGEQLDFHIKYNEYLGKYVVIDSGVSLTTTLEPNLYDIDVAAPTQAKDVLDLLYRPDAEALRGIGNVRFERTGNLIPVERFFTQVYEAFASLEMKDFDDLLEDNEDNRMTLGAVKYTIASMQASESYIKTSVRLSLKDIVYDKSNDDYLYCTFGLETKLNYGGTTTNFAVAINRDNNKIVKIEEITEGEAWLLAKDFKQKFDEYQAKNGTEQSIEYVTDAIIMQEFVEK